MELETFSINDFESEYDEESDVLTVHLLDGEPSQPILQNISEGVDILVDEATGRTYAIYLRDYMANSEESVE